MLMFELKGLIIHGQSRLYGKLGLNLVQSPVLSCQGSPRILGKILHVGSLSGSIHGIM